MSVEKDNIRLRRSVNDKVTTDFSKELLTELFAFITSKHFTAIVHFAHRKCEELCSDMKRFHINVHIEDIAGKRCVAVFCFMLRVNVNKRGNRFCTRRLLVTSADAAYLWRSDTVTTSFTSPHVCVWTTKRAPAAAAAPRDPLITVNQTPG